MKMRISDSLTSSDRVYYRVTGGNFSDISKIDIKKYDSNALIDLYINDNNLLSKNIIKCLKNIKDKLILTLEKDNLILIGLSVYIIYEKNNPNKCKAYLIDFAHSKVTNKKHESGKYCILGIENLINKIKELL